jgi:hypothetical protein
MKNLINYITKENKRELNDSINDLKKETSISDILNKWYYRQLIPVSSKNKEWANVDELINYLIKRIIKRSDKKLMEKLNHLESVKNAKELESITIAVEWKRSQTWGSNPRAEAKVCYIDNTCDYFDSGSVSGYGYDKNSTAVASAVNQSLSLKKLLYEYKNKAVETKNHELFSYGSGYGILPQLEHAVGVSCYNSILNKIGFKFETIASGGSFDVYKISKM